MYYFTCASHLWNNTLLVHSWQFPLSTCLSDDNITILKFSRSFIIIIQKILYSIAATEKYQMVYEENTGKVSLMIKSIGPGDEGEYTCTALNPYGEAICTVYISPEATKSVKKSKSGAKLHKSSSNKQILMAQQQQQV